MQSGRPGRKRCTAAGIFTPCLLVAAEKGLEAKSAASGTGPGGGPVEVWLRKPPQVDGIADEVHQLRDVERKRFSLINQILEKKHGRKIGSGNCCAAWRRWYEIRSLPLPERKSAAGRPRKIA